MRLVLIEWIDSFGGNGRWDSWIDGDDPEPVVCTSVGRLIVDGERHKVVMPHWHEKNEARRVARNGCGEMIIPTVAVLRMVDLAKLPPPMPEIS